MHGGGDAFGKPVDACKVLKPVGDLAARLTWPVPQGWVAHTSACLSLMDQDLLMGHARGACATAPIFFISLCQ